MSFRWKVRDDFVMHFVAKSPRRKQRKVVMRARGLIVFVILNVLISIGVALGVIALLGPSEGDSTAVGAFATVLVYVTPPPGPSQTPFIITATPRPGEIADLPEGVLDATPTIPIVTVDATAAALGTVAPAALTANPELGAGAAGPSLPENCIQHTLQEGEFPSLLAEQYETDVASILLANGLSEEDALLLQIGQVLIIPREGCPLDQFVAAAAQTQTAVALESPATEAADAGTPDPNAPTTEGEATPADGTLAEAPTPSITPTITLAPTAQNAQIEIQEIVGAGDITAESVILFNTGRSVDVAGWTLSDLDGNVYTFPELRFFNDGSLEILTRVGEDTPVVKFWGLSEAAWGPGDVATLRDADGNVQSVFRIPAPVSLD
jgi:LysM repeat protein